MIYKYSRWSDSKIDWGTEGVSWKCGKGVLFVNCSLQSAKPYKSVFPSTSLEISNVWKHFKVNNVPQYSVFQLKRGWEWLRVLWSTCIILFKRISRYNSLFHSIKITIVLPETLASHWPLFSLCRWKLEPPVLPWQHSPNISPSAIHINSSAHILYIIYIWQLVFKR